MNNSFQLDQSLATLFFAELLIFNRDRLTRLYFNIKRNVDQRSIFQIRES